MIRFFDESDLDAYREAGDPLLALLGDPRAEGLTCERWLSESEAKRAVTWSVYGPLLTTERQRILDIGAGFSSLSFLMAERHDYLVADLDPPPPGIRSFMGDWSELPSMDFDLVISVDLFPNVDQRFEQFLARFGKTPLRLVVTTYADRWYRAERTEGEVLTVKAWTWEQTRPLLDVDVMAPERSLFPNGRQVCLVTT